MVLGQTSPRTWAGLEVPQQAQKSGVEKFPCGRFSGKVQRFEGLFWESFQVLARFQKRSCLGSSEAHHPRGSFMTSHIKSTAAIPDAKA